MCLQAQGVDDKNSGFDGGIQAQGLSYNDGGVDRGRGIYDASEGSETTIEVRGLDDGPK